MTISITEAIITTLNDDNEPYHAPFGFVMENDLVRIAPFRPSRSLEFLLKQKEAVLNMTDNPIIFAGCLTGRKEFETIPATSIKGFGLKDAVRRWELILEEVREDKTRPQLFFRIHHESHGALWQGHHRGRAAIIEACVFLSRLHILPEDTINETMKRLEDIIERTAGEQERMAWQWLVDYHQQWQKKHDKKHDKKS